MAGLYTQIINSQRRFTISSVKYGPVTVQRNIVSIPVIEPQP